MLETQKCLRSQVLLLALPENLPQKLTCGSLPMVSILYVSLDPIVILSVASILLHLLHPYALQNLRDAIAHVRRFRDELDPLPPKGESAQIAKDILMDAADSSGVDLQKLLSTLDEIKNMLKYSGMFPPENVQHRADVSV